MSFTQSMINQIGRDAGKVVSNAIYGDAHAAPRRMVGGKSSGGSTNSTTIESTTKRVVKSEFEKALNFQMGFKPNTLVNKLSGVQIVLKNEMKAFMVDEYLSVDESNQLLSMLNDFNSKISDVYDIVKLDEEKNAKEITIIDKILEQMIVSFCDVLTKTIDGCKFKIANTKKPSFIKHILTKMFFLKSVGGAIGYNLLSIIITSIGSAYGYPIPVLNILATIFAIIGYPFKLSEHNKNVKSEQDRIEMYSKLKLENEKTLEELK